VSTQWPTRLRVDMEGASREDLITRLDAQAAQFFGATPYRLTGEVEAEVGEKVQDVSGHLELLTWTGYAYFETLP
jgi:hypothetical protein